MMNEEKMPGHGEILDSCREQTSEGGTITKKEAWDSVERFALHAIRTFDSEGRKKAFSLIEAALEFQDLYVCRKRLKGCGEDE